MVVRHDFGHVEGHQQTVWIVTAMTDVDENTILDIVICLDWGWNNRG
jgi:hypothetical protein